MPRVAEMFMHEVILFSQALLWYIISQSIMFFQPLLRNNLSDHHSELFCFPQPVISIFLSREGYKSKRKPSVTKEQKGV